MLVEVAAIAAVPVEAEVLVVRRYIHPSISTRNTSEVLDSRAADVRNELMTSTYVTKRERQNQLPKNKRN
jgi:hypothetical protein